MDFLVQGRFDFTTITQLKTVDSILRFCDGAVSRLIFIIIELESNGSALLLYCSYYYELKFDLSFHVVQKGVEETK